MYTQKVLGSLVMVSTSGVTYLPCSFSVLCFIV